MTNDMNADSESCVRLMRAEAERVFAYELHDDELAIPILDMEEELDFETRRLSDPDHERD